MADKYLIHGATYCGDGTANNEAASAGAAGAWNNINVLTGTAPAQGSLAAGDVVYIRSKTSAGADIDITLGAASNLGSTKATQAAPITWILDDGTEWSGVSGALTITQGTSATAYTLTFKAWNRIISRAQDAFVIKSLLTANAACGVNLETGHMDGVMFESSASVGTSARHVLVPQVGVEITLKNTHIKNGGRSSTTGILNYTVNNGRVVLVNPDIELLEVSTEPLFSSSSSNTSMSILGGRIRGAGATSGVPLFYGGSSIQAVVVGLDYPKTMSLTNSQQGVVGPVTLFGADGGFGSSVIHRGGTVDSRQDGNYPYLTAAYPDSAATGWSWKLYPKYAEFTEPLYVDAAKAYTAAADTKTVTAELLVSDTITGLDSYNLWIDGYYIDDTTGDTVGFSTQPEVTGSAIATSTAAWSSTAYGSVSLLKRKITFTTPTSIKQDTVVCVRLTSTYRSLSADDILFFCPDIQLS